MVGRMTAEIPGNVGSEDGVSLRSHLKGNVQFLFYRKGLLWYKTDAGFRFPVPVEDCGDGTFRSEDRAILFMRYIRKAWESK